MKTIIAQKNGVIDLGHQGDYAVREVKFPVKEIIEEYGPDGLFTLFNVRPAGLRHHGDPEGYPVADISLDGDYLVWIPNETDLAFNGMGEAQLRYSMDGKCVHSDIYSTSNKRSLVENENPPEPYLPYIDRVVEAGSHGPYIGDNDHWFVWNFQNGRYEDTGISATGGDLVMDVTVNGDSVVEDKIAAIKFKTIDGQEITGEGNIDTGGGTSDFDQLTNRPKYNGETMTHSTDIPEVKTATWDAKSDFSGSYNDLTDKPAIPTVPTNVSAFTNDAGYLTQHQDISGKINEPSQDGTAGQVLATNGEGGRYWKTVEGGGGGTSDYTDLENKPQINSVTLTGNKTLSQLGGMDLADYDADNAVADAGGIAPYVAANGGKIDTIQFNGEDLPIVDKTVNIELSSDLMSETYYDADGSVKDAGGIAAYVDANGGKIDHIKVNNTEQTIINKTVDITVPTSLSALTDDSGHRLVTDTEKSTWNSKSDFSGSYNDLDDKPTIPASLSQLSDDATHRLVTDTEKSTWDAKGDMQSSVYDPDNGAKQVAFKDSVTAIEGKIPAQATSSNQLADKDFVNSSIENVAAYYITKDAAGNPFSTKAELNAATTFYSGGVIRVPTRNDYCVVLADESKTITETGENPTTRYIYDNNTWSYQYIVNRSGLTAAQWATVNSGLTAGMLPSGVSSTDKLVKSSGLSTVATSGSYNDLSNKPTIPSAVTESTVSGWGFTKNTGTYSKPSDGIPKTDLVSAVQTSLEKADSALQSFTETDPTVPSWAKASTKPTYTASEVGLGNVGNFKAVSTVASQGLTSTEKSNARANIGAGTSSFSGSYNDLTDKPAIPTVPTNVSAFTNDAGYLTQHQDISGKENTSNKVSSWSTTPNNTKYPTEKLVKDTLDTKVRTFVQAGEPTGANNGDFWIDTDETASAFIPDGAIQMSSISGLTEAIAAAKPASYTGTLTVDGWNNNAQTLSNAFFLTGNYRYVVAPAPSKLKAYGEAQIYADDVTTSGQMTFYCESVPEEAMIVYITREALQ